MTTTPLRRRAVEAMGTVFCFSWCPLLPENPDAVDEALRAAAAGLEEADRVFSTWKADSPMSRIRRGELACSEWPDIAAVLDRCRELREASRGWFDPWAAPGGVDPTGMVKGMATAAACTHLGQAGVPAGSVNGAGDVATLPGPGPDGSGCWRVGVRHPWRPEALAGIVELPAGSAIASSGTYERGEHLWNPRGGPVAARAATVCGPDLVTADAFATALAVGGTAFLPVLEATDGWEGWFVTPEGIEHQTGGFPWAA